MDQFKLINMMVVGILIGGGAYLVTSGPKEEESSKVSVGFTDSEFTIEKFTYSYSYGKDRVEVYGRAKNSDDVWFSHRGESTEDFQAVVDWLCYTHGVCAASIEQPGAVPLWRGGKKP